MKRYVFLIGLFWMTASVVSQAQMVIATGSGVPDPSAMLDVQSVTGGFLAPRMTIAERNSIFEPATGLVVFCTDDNQFYSNSGTPVAPVWTPFTGQWSENGTSLYYSGGNVGIGVTSPQQTLHVNGNIAPDFGLAGSASYVFGDGSENTGFSSPAINGIAWVNNGIQSVRSDAAGRVEIGTGTPDPSAKLEVASSTRGFLPPRMTTAQRNAIVNPAAGLMIYNTDDKAINIYRGGGWSFPGGHSCGTPFVDPRNGRTYQTVKIGTQCWMRDNLNLGVMVASINDQVNDGILEKYCYGNLVSNCDQYGGLYQWGEAVQYLNGASNTANWSPAPTGQVQGICPTGWHLPSYAEWNTLVTALGGSAVAGGKMKSTDATLWSPPNTGATNSSGFTGLPAGDCYYTNFVNLSNYAFFWVTTPQAATTAWYMRLDYDNAAANLLVDAKSIGFSVRCVKN